MLKEIIFLVVLSSSGVFSEAPSNNFGPYPAAGWRPNRPFNSPSEYPQRNVLYQRQQRRPGSPDLEITKARIDYFGQIKDTNFLLNSRQPQKQYLPPNRQNDFLNIQGLPLETILQQYNPPAQQKPPNQQQQFFPRPLRPQYRPQNEVPRQPAKEYGVPETTEFNIIYPEPEPRNVEESDQPAKQSISGGDVSDYSTDDDEDMTKSFVRAKQGQYYVLGPDNTLQRVAFTATQDEEEQRTNGFTAQLKYTPVGELRDPVFRYNNRGQLVRALKK